MNELFDVNFDRLKLAGEVARRIRKMRDFKPEMAKVGDWLIEDAKRRLADRESQVSIGRLAKSLRRKAFRLQVVITSVLPYARIQQMGGTVKPNKRKWMAVPIRLQDKRVHLWPKHVSGKPGVSLRFVPVRANFALLIYRKVSQKKRSKKQGGGTITIREEYPRWFLIKKAKIPGRPYLVKSPELIAYMRKLIMEKLRDTGLGAG